MKVPEFKKFRPLTLQGINISHLGKRKIIFKMPFLGDMLIPWRVIVPLNLDTVYSNLSCWETFLVAQLPMNGFKMILKYL